MAGASLANGAEVEQFTCTSGARNQMFELLEDSSPNVAGFTSRIRALHSGKCLDVSGASNANGAHVVQFTCGNGAHQRFDGIAFA